MTKDTKPEEKKCPICKTGGIKNGRHIANAFPVDKEEWWIKEFEEKFVKQGDFGDKPIPPMIIIPFFRNLISKVASQSKEEEREKLEIALKYNVDEETAMRVMNAMEALDRGDELITKLTKTKEKAYKEGQTLQVNGTSYQTPKEIYESTTYPNGFTSTRRQDEKDERNALRAEAVAVYKQELIKEIEKFDFSWGRPPEDMKKDILTLISKDK
jgi:hypothetical protein